VRYCCSVTANVPGLEEKLFQYFIWRFYRTDLCKDEDFSDDRSTCLYCRFVFNNRTRKLYNNGSDGESDRGSECNSNQHNDHNSEKLGSQYNGGDRDNRSACLSFLLALCINSLYDKNNNCWIRLEMSLRFQHKSFVLLLLKCGSEADCFACNMKIKCTVCALIAFTNWRS